jgi:rhodanese-related sulfurtransferase
MARLHWTPNRALAAAALLLGGVAIAGNPYRGSTVRLDTQELANIVSTEVDHVTPRELADWIIQGRTDYRLIDLRAERDFAGYHIPTAENVPVALLPKYGLGRDERIVLYSEGGIHSAQAWFLLKAQRYPGVYILFGGLEAWKEEVLYPVAPAAATPRENATFEREAQVARFFGGRSRAATAAADSGSLNAMPAVPNSPSAGIAPPQAPAAGGPARPGAKKKRKEGC